jgi:dihydrodipicolinate synthase/N-acetylneuraminate lyase
LGNVWPKIELEFFDHLEQSEQVAALKIVNEIEHPYRVATQATRKYWSCLKFMLDKIGLPGGYMRPPILDLNRDDKVKITDMCTKTGLI